MLLQPLISLFKVAQSTELHVYTTFQDIVQAIGLQNSSTS